MEWNNNCCSFAFGTTNDILAVELYHLCRPPTNRTILAFVTASSVTLHCDSGEVDLWPVWLGKEQRLRVFGTWMLRAICGPGRGEFRRGWQNCLFRSIIICMGVQYREAQLVEALRYEPEGRGFDFRWCHWNFSLKRSFRPPDGPADESASNWNKYRDVSWGKDGRRVMLTTLPPSCAGCLEILGASSP